MQEIMLRIQQWLADNKDIREGDWNIKDVSSRQS